MSVELICYIKTIIVFYKFYDFFCRRHSLMNRSCYNNLFQFMQHDNFRNLNRVIFTHWKHLESLVNAFWYYLMKSAPIPRNQSSLEILRLFKERVKLWFFVTFNIILRHIFHENFIEFPHVVQKIWRNFLSVLASFHQFSSIFWIFSDITFLQRN